MSILDQKMAAQNGQAAVFANDAALALSRQVAQRQRQIAQEIRTPVIVETPADFTDKKERSNETDAGKNAIAAHRDEEAERGVDANPLDLRRIDVRI